MLTTKEKMIVKGFKMIKALALPGMTLGNFVGRNIPNGDASIAYGIIFSVVGAPVSLLSLAVFGPVLMAYDKVFNATDLMIRQHAPHGNDEDLIY